MTAQTIAGLRDSQVISALLENPNSTPWESKKVISITNDFCHGSKSITFAQRDLLNSYLWKANSRMEKCPKCGGNLVDYVGYVGGRGYVSFKACANSLKSILVVRTDGSDYYDAECDYVRQN